MTLKPRQWKNISLFLTVSRLLVGPIFFLFYISHGGIGLSIKVVPFILLILITLSEVSDFFDGYIARKFNVVTDLGKVLDPMCDSVTRSIIFLTLTLPPVNLPIWLIFIFVFRDGVIGVLRTICALKGVALAARQSGKIKAIIQAVSVYVIVVAMAWHAYGGISLFVLQLIAVYTMACGAIITLLSALEYLKVNWKHVVSVSRVEPRHK
ncbi:CDP-diacylglycerol--glycerol-3-phosphate 3-phosphatidyltransferase [Candidatus Aerophobetes bacterium]|uniref:CDP-diacylglycerol--glycerol-3-phosphate 3-phosphatidyltransferase n=1 Tax=Aerophobetes bacterium TaxID=2030807 RepID=A0A2A4X5T7_UNCAE|nr:MAG: CDP-diacylglycerol--glycerol-3-phosphate 3-phosphatidyltransferase [Candidatus Aerophobetes bacterium]